MKIRWFGHSCFYIESETGAKILTDPFAAEVGYAIPSVEADIVIVSHQHYDHNNIKAVKGNFSLFKTAGLHEFKNIKIKGISTFHDDEGGRKRGENIVFTIDVDEMRLCHLGDLGHIPDENQLKEIGDVDILMIPVGGIFTIDAKQAFKIVEMIKPGLVIPMHYKTAALKFELGSVEDFIKQFEENKIIKAESAEVLIDDIKKLQDKIILLKYIDL